MPNFIYAEDPGTRVARSGVTAVSIWAVVIGVINVGAIFSNPSANAASRSNINVGKLTNRPILARFGLQSNFTALFAPTAISNTSLYFYVCKMALRTHEVCPFTATRANRI